MTEPRHVPVLVREALDLLDPRPGQSALDLTAGLGGHALAIAERLAPGGVIALVDRDASNLAYATDRVKSTGVIVYALHANFDAASGLLAERPFRADLVLADLGFASNQMDDPARGLSFSNDAPLDMRLDNTQGRTAAELLARLSEAELADLIYHLGEDPFARRIARKLAQIRQREPIRSTARLASAVVEAYGPRARSSRMHPATRTFMALRIAVNDELGSLQRLLAGVREAAENVARGEPAWIKPQARIAIITFHSLEDRLVKHAFKDMITHELATALTRKPLTAGDEETRANPRSRSAKLRAIMIGEHRLRTS